MVDQHRQDFDAIVAREEQLLHRAHRGSPDAVAALLTDDFVEFAGSGRFYGKAETVASLAAEDGGESWKVKASGFALKTLAPDVALLTYRTARRQAGKAFRRTLRSSVWARYDGQWRLAFHQGTPTTFDEDDPQ